MDEPQTDQRSDSELIEATADVIERRGFCIGKLVNPIGAVCVDGALAEVLGFDLSRLYRIPDDLRTETVYDDPELNRLAGRIADALGLPGVLDGSTASARAAALYEWNDSMGTEYRYAQDRTARVAGRQADKQRVLDGLRRAAKIIRQADENEG